MAVGSMVTSIVGLLFVSCYGFGGLIGLVGAILGHVAKKQIRANNEGGGGMALAGIIVGWISVALMIIIWVAIGIFLATSWEDMDDSTY
jgi:hypothetical protein